MKSKTMKAIETNDEKDENIYIYFDAPQELYGNDIKYKMNVIMRESYHIYGV